jgi:pyridoxine 4-dehydrogenase
MTICATSGLEALDVVNLRVMGGVHAPSEESIASNSSALAELQRQGLIRHLGLSNVTSTQIEEARGIARIVCVQNHYNLAHRDDDALIDRRWPGAGSPMCRSSRSAASRRSSRRRCRRWRRGCRRDADAGRARLAAAAARANILLIPGTSSVDGHLRRESRG